MKIVLSGYGRMGKAVEKAALENNHEIIFRIDTVEDWKTNAHLIHQADVVIDFSFPTTAFDNIMRCFDHNVAVVSGTTGWLDRFEKVRERCLSENQAFVFASNFSIGVNVLFAMNKKLAVIMSRFPQYDVQLSEKHHIHKQDAPSGTAITLADDILKNNPGKNKWTLDAENGTDDLVIEALREGEAIGTHYVRYNSPFDEIQLKHRAKDRSGFASGALFAAEWLQGKSGCFTMQDVLGL